MTNQIFRFFVLNIALLLILAGCQNSTRSVIVEADEEIPEKFPAEVTFNYYIPNELKGLYGDDIYIALEYISGSGRGHYFNAYPVKKTDQGYIVIGSDHENYTFPDITKKGYLEPIQLKNQNGKFTIKINNKYEYSLLKDYSIYTRDICEYYKCSISSDTKQKD